MKIIVDERERDLYQALYAYIHSQSTPLPLQLEKDTLPLGDISIRRDEDDKEWVLLERKTLRDLIASIKDKRYEEQSYRLTHSTPPDFQLHNICYLIEGPLNTIRNPIERKMVLGSMASLYFFKGFQVMRTSSVEDTAEWIASLALKIERGFAEKKLPWFIRWESITQLSPQPQAPLSPPNSSTDTGTGTDPPLQQPPSVANIPESIIEREPEKAYCSVVKRTKGANVTPENIGEIVLCQIPSVGPETAISVMQKYEHSIAKLVHALETEGPQCIEQLTTLDSKGHSRKISKACVANIYRFLVEGNLKPQS
jgi:ERCC4-type nuclease